MRFGIFRILLYNIRIKLLGIIKARQPQFLRSVIKKRDFLIGNLLFLIRSTRRANPSAVFVD